MNKATEGNENRNTSRAFRFIVAEWSKRSGRHCEEDVIVADHSRPTKKLTQISWWQGGLCCWFGLHKQTTQ